MFDLVWPWTLTFWTQTWRFHPCPKMQQCWKFGENTPNIFRDIVLTFGTHRQNHRQTEAQTARKHNASHRTIIITIIIIICWQSHKYMESKNDTSQQTPCWHEWLACNSNVHTKYLVPTTLATLTIVSVTDRQQRTNKHQTFQTPNTVGNAQQPLCLKLTQNWDVSNKAVQSPLSHC